MIELSETQKNKLFNKLISDVQNYGITLRSKPNTLSPFEKEILDRGGDVVTSFFQDHDPSPESAILLIEKAASIKQEFDNAFNLINFIKIEVGDKLLTPEENDLWRASIENESDIETLINKVFELSSAANNVPEEGKQSILRMFTYDTISPEMTHTELFNGMIFQLANRIRINSYDIVENSNSIIDVYEANWTKGMVELLKDIRTNHEIFDTPEKIQEKLEEFNHAINIFELFKSFDDEEKARLISLGNNESIKYLESILSGDGEDKQKPENNSDKTKGPGDI